jgi:P27 family predicted phage terminase small subunit
MAEELQVYWDYAVSLVDHLRCVSDSDAVQLLVLAEALRDFVDAEEELRVNGGEVMDDKGKRSANPALARKQSAYARIKDSLDRFGLNPANRSRVTALAPKLGEIQKMPEVKKSRYAD